MLIVFHLFKVKQQQLYSSIMEFPSFLSNLIIVLSIHIILQTKASIFSD